MLAVEAAKNAQEIHGTADITAEQMRDGMETLNMPEAKLEELGFAGFIPPFEVTCQDHGPPGHGAIQQWDAEAKEWTLVTDFIAPDEDIIQPLIEEDSTAYAQEAGIEPRECEELAVEGMTEPSEESAEPAAEGEGTTESGN